MPKIKIRVASLSYLITKPERVNQSESGKEKKKIEKRERKIESRNPRGIKL